MPLWLPEPAPASPQRRLFAGPRAARAAGFRACRRCGEASSAAEPVLEICRFLESEAGRVPTLEELSERFGVSPGHLQRVFKRRVGISPRAYADALRVDRLKEKLRGGDSVTNAMYETGYGSPSRLYESASRTLGMTPRAYRNKAQGEVIIYATVRCPVGGHVLVAATTRGLCSVRMGARVRELVNELGDEFSGATLERGDGPFTESLLAYLRGLRPLPELPLDVRATAFQRRVWEAIRAVPAGETVTYSEVASQIGSPRAARAVARACAQNPVALAIPCHRVVPKTAGGGGYRWGIARKERLLRLEAALAEAATSEERPSPR